MVARSRQKIFAASLHIFLNLVLNHYIMHRWFLFFTFLITGYAMGDTVEYVQLNNGYKVWTKRVGHGPIKVLLLHGGPGCSAGYLEEPFQAHCVQDEFELIFYDQLGSRHSDQPHDLSLWTIERFREEVEEVRKGLQLEDFYLYGQSWGGMLAIEYALKYQHHLKGLILSNTPGSITSYEYYVDQLRSQLPQSIQEQMQAFEDKGAYLEPDYQDFIFRELYTKHLCRCQPWPEIVHLTFQNLNSEIYQEMQGPSEFTVTGNFKNWNRWEDFSTIHVSTLVISGRYDTINPEDTVKIASLIPQARAVICEQGSHLSLYDDPASYFEAIRPFLNLRTTSQSCAKADNHK
jgi:proline iminopeptidase